jgi:hypothetical protein
MSAPTASATLAEIESRQPAMVRLAELVALAARVEPALLRQVRHEFAPDLGPEVEAELWFGPLTESYGAAGFVLDLDYAEILRTRLARRPDLLIERVAESIARAHTGAPASIRLEEKVTALAMGGAGTEALEKELRPALLALRDPARSLDVARWLTRALPRLPEAALRTEAAFMLALGASEQFGGRRIVTGDFHGRLPASAAWTIPPGSLAKRTRIGVRLLDTGFEFLEAGQPAMATIELPATEPLWLEIAWGDGSERYARTVQIHPGRKVDDLPEGALDVTLRTLAGDVFRVETQEADSAQPMPFHLQIRPELSLADLEGTIVKSEEEGIFGGFDISFRLTGLRIGKNRDGRDVNIATFHDLQTPPNERIFLIPISSTTRHEDFQTYAEHVSRNGAKLVALTDVLIHSEEISVAAVRANPDLDVESFPTETPPFINVFLDYHPGDDEEFVRILQRDLEEHGVRVHGRDVLSETSTHAAIEGSEVMLVILGPGSARSEMHARYWRMALEMNKRVIPVLHHRDEGLIPQELRDIQAADFREKVPYHRALDDLLATIRRKVSARNPALEPRTMALAGVLQSIALPFHVHFRSSEIDPKRIEEFLNSKEHNGSLNAEQFKLVRTQCEWVIKRMVEQFVSPSWKQAPEGTSPQWTFPDFVKSAVTQGAQFNRMSSKPLQANLEIRPEDMPIFEDLLLRTGLTLERRFRSDFSIVEREPGAAVSALERLGPDLLELLVEMGYHPWSVPSDDPQTRELRALAALVSALCDEVDLGRDKENSIRLSVGDAIREYVAPLWHRTRRELLALETPGISPSADFHEFLRAFNEIVAKLLVEAHRELGDFEMHPFPVDTNVAEEMLRLAPAPQRLIVEKESAKGQLSQFIEIFRRASRDLMDHLEQLRPARAEPGLRSPVRPARTRRVPR